jgi:glucose/arabinose dehydrogenase
VANVNSYRELLMIEKPWDSHNAGMMKFGPDGYLYIAVGDGGRIFAGQFGAFAQTLDDLLGNILRIDPSAQPDGARYRVPPDNPFVGVAGARPEIWAYGLRNPWRFDIDSASGDLYLGDVGEGVMEEIDVIPGARGGQNFGWPCFEGTATFPTTATCPNSVPPAFAYEHAKQGCSVIGGVIAHDPRLPQLRGRFLYGDFCNPEIRSLIIERGRVLDDRPIGANLAQTVSFGEDGLGHIYVMSLADHGLYRLDPAP